MKIKSSAYLVSRLWIAILLLISILLFGWAGYYFYFNYTVIDAFYMTVITVCTVGYGEVNALDHEGKLFTALLIILSVIVFAYSITTISAYLINVNTIFNFKQKNMKKAINNLKDHVIICGYGRNGQQAASKLLVYQQKFMVIEQDEEALALLEDGNIPYIDGDATEDEVLIEAGIERAKYMITTLPSDADNVFITLSARQLNKELTIISRASENSSISKLKIAGVDNVIMPDKIGGDHMASLIVAPDLLEFLDNLSTAAAGKMNFQEIKLINMPDIRTINDLNISLRTGCTIVGYKTKANDYIINPDHDQAVEPQGRIIVLGRTEQIKKLNLLFKLN